MSTTPVSICSAALQMLGEKPFASFTDNSERARVAAGLWDGVRDHVLRSHPWNSAIKREALAPDATAPVFGFSRAFSIPPDCLRVLSIGQYESDRPAYKIEGRKILTDEPAVFLRYVFRNEDCGTWDAGLVWGMTTVMRAVFAYPVTQSTSLEQVVEQALRSVLKSARAADALEDTPDAMDDNPLLMARYGARSF
jgi:hypothetical protein